MTGPFPEPPQGVRFVRRDGEVIPLEVVYRGFDTTLTVHVWVAVLVLPDDERAGGSVLTGTLPAHTMITLEMYRPG